MGWSVKLETPTVDLIVSADGSIGDLSQDFVLYIPEGRFDPAKLACEGREGWIVQNLRGDTFAKLIRRILSGKLPNWRVEPMPEPAIEEETSPASGTVDNQTVKLQDILAKLAELTASLA